MAKNRQEPKQPIKPDRQPDPPIPPQRNQNPPSRAAENRKVPQHLRCPVCFNGRGGTGKQKWWRAISSATTKQCYVCQVCGHEWTATIKRILVEIEHKEVEVEYDDGPDLETR